MRPDLSSEQSDNEGILSRNLILIAGVEKEVDGYICGVVGKFCQPEIGEPRLNIRMMRNVKKG